MCYGTLAAGQSITKPLWLSLLTYSGIIACVVFILTQIEQWSKCRTTSGALFSRLLGLTLPASLQTTTTLRVLEVWQGGWLAGPCRHYQTGEFYLQAGRDHIKLANAADEIARRDAVLRPLSLALPELRILMHANDMARTPKGASMRWWHARCGYDWTDPVFF